MSRNERATHINNFLIKFSFLHSLLIREGYVKEQRKKEIDIRYLQLVAFRTHLNIGEVKA